MPRSTRGGGRSTPQSLLLPFALTLTTAAIASAGLYWFSSESSPPSSYPGSDSEHEPSRHRRRRERRRRDHLTHDHITEEDTDAIEESRREEELYRKRKAMQRATSMGGVVEYMKEAAAGAYEKMRGDSEDYEFAEEEELQRPQGPHVPRETPRIDTAPTISAHVGETARDMPTSFPISAVAGPAASAISVPAIQQYVPAPKRKKTIAIVVAERKATQGHDSDGEFEEALIPSRSLLSQLPRPLDLKNVNLYILIYSPHLPTNPLATASPKKAPSSTDTLTIQAPEPMPSPSLQASRYEDFTKSTYELATSLLPADAPRDHILPYTDATSFAGILKTLDTDVTYFEDNIAESQGPVIDEMLNTAALRRVVIVIGGDELDGLISSDEETTGERHKRHGEGKWWAEDSEIRKRHGKRVEIVEKWALEDDWRRRIEED